MKTYKFEIQNCINVEIEGDSPEHARMKLINELDKHADEMIGGNCYVSDGEEKNV